MIKAPSVLLVVFVALIGLSAALFSWNYNVKTAEGAACPAAAFATNVEPAKHIIEQYKVYVTDLASVGAQFSTTETFYLTIIAALIGVLTLKDKTPPVRYYLSPVASFVFLFIAAICVVWWLTSEQFLNLVGAKFSVLKCMEKSYPALYPMFSTQSEYYLNSTAGLHGIIRNQSLLELSIGVCALVFALLGILKSSEPGRTKSAAASARHRGKARST